MDTCHILLRTSFQESEELEYYNQNLKRQIHNLELEKRRFLEVLSSSDPTLAKRLKSMTTITSSSASSTRVHVVSQMFQEPQGFPGQSVVIGEPPLFSDAENFAGTRDLDVQNIPNIKVEAVDDFLKPAANFGRNGSSKE